jgi:perosamine synthetase
MNMDATTPALCLAPDKLARDVVTAVRQVLGKPTQALALHEPEFAGREWDYLKDCLDTGWVSSAGAYVDRFGRDLAAYTGAACAVATSNGTSALHICLLLVGVLAGDEVLVPTLTFVATANAVSYVGATPHFVDSEAVSLGVDAARLDAYLGDIAQVVNGVCMNRHTGAPVRALIVMHVFGHPADTDSLCEVANRWQLTVIEDAAGPPGLTLSRPARGQRGSVVGAQLQRQQGSHYRGRRGCADE